jgi:acyl-[acyl-carrier-protein] desaturase
MSQVTHRWAIGTPFDRLYKSFFDRSEHHRRWKLDVDIRWEDRAEQVPDALVVLAETFWAVESFLPDYTADLAKALRTERGRVWLHAMWAYEESKHGRAFEEWLVRGGHRSEEQLNDLTDAMWSAGKWAMPHDTDRKLLIYQMLQEAMTRLVYSRFRRLAQDAGDIALTDVLRHLASDEQAHYGFFRDCVRVWLDDDLEGTIADIYEVLLSFSMPAGELIPDYGARDTALSAANVASPYLFLTKVWIPTAATLDVDPVPPLMRPLRDMGHSVDEIIGMLVGGAPNDAAIDAEDDPSLLSAPV